jgi:Mrp family chromosome partitioning ATPase
MEHALQRYSRHFDFVLLDSAPLLPVFDSHVLTSRCDASVLVVRSGKTSTNAVKTSLELVGRVGGRMSGVVLNHVNLHDYAHSYCNKYYSAYDTSPRAGGNRELNRGEETAGVP